MYIESHTSNANRANYSSLYNDDILISLIYMYMETDLSRSCADLKGVGGWVGGGRWWKIQFFYSSDHHMANINTPPRKKKF